MKLNNSNLALAVMASLLLVAANTSLAQTIDFSDAETLGTGFVASMRGTIATIAFSVAFIVTGFLAMMNKISWFWLFGVVLGAFLVFGGPGIVANLRAAFT
ncbi:TrbC/VirB2 family protein [uncultured Tateyamaria sp.]|uniref:TrbC/VirB2 family protein n=1 Tax=uncultured Tateyamaria sp. TaxID=455651 RepID=UPI0026118370|nr:TrbC/VirB2 family protein [uncultured Tateyamaria sp.]